VRVTFLVDPFLVAVVLGLTAGICPITLFFAVPALSYIAAKPKNVRDAVELCLKFSSGVVIVFTPLGFFGSKIVEAMRIGRGWLYLAVAVVTFTAGFVVLSPFRIRYGRMVYKMFGPKRFTSGAFLYGVWFGLITLARAAPLLMSTLMLASLVPGVIGAMVLCLYALCMSLPTTFLIAYSGTKKARNFVDKFSRKLEVLSGGLLLLIGSYYFYLWLPLAHRI